MMFSPSAENVKTNHAFIDNTFQKAIKHFGIHGNEIHAGGPSGDHPVDDVVARAADADDFNLYHALLKIRHICSSYV